MRRSSNGTYVSREGGRGEEEERRAGAREGKKKRVICTFVAVLNEIVCSRRRPEKHADRTTQPPFPPFLPPSLPPPLSNSTIQNKAKNDRILMEKTFLNSEAGIYGPFDKYGGRELWREGEKDGILMSARTFCKSHLPFLPPSPL